MFPSLSSLGLVFHFQDLPFQTYGNQYFLHYMMITGFNLEHLGCPSVDTAVDFLSGKANSLTQSLSRWQERTAIYPFYESGNQWTDLQSAGLPEPSRDTRFITGSIVYSLGVDTDRHTYGLRRHVYNVAWVNPQTDTDRHTHTAGSES